jgi:hypothetical protein
MDRIAIRLTHGEQMICESCGETVIGHRTNEFAVGEVFVGDPEFFDPKVICAKCYQEEFDRTEGEAHKLASA